MLEYANICFLYLNRMKYSYSWSVLILHPPGCAYTQVEERTKNGFDFASTTYRESLSQKHQCNIGARIGLSQHGSRCLIKDGILC